MRLSFLFSFRVLSGFETRPCSHPAPHQNLLWISTEEHFHQYKLNVFSWLPSFTCRCLDAGGWFSGVARRNSGGGALAAVHHVRPARRQRFPLASRGRPVAAGESVLPSPWSLPCVTISSLFFVRHIVVRRSLSLSMIGFCCAGCVGWRGDGVAVAVVVVVATSAVAVTWSFSRFRQF